MRTRYSIGLLITSVLMVLLITAGYRAGHQYAKEKHTQQLETEERTPITNSVNTEAEAVKDTGYYLRILNGYVTVYLGDKQTIYEYTDITVDSLPENVAQEIRETKYIETAEELYGFLENYSS